jgi:S1-C subfamily serine protease
MKTALGFALVLLSTAAPSAPAAGIAASATALAGNASLFFLGAAGTPPTRPAQGYLGVSVRDVSQDEVVALKLKDTHGAEIILVDHDAPAGKAGLREHDVVLIMNGQAIEGQDQLRRMLHESPPGKSIVLIVSRDGQLRTVSTQMAVSQEQVEREAFEQRLTVPDPSDPPADSATTGFSPSSPPSPPPVHGNSFIGNILMNSTYTGAILEKVSTQLADFFGVPNGAGLLVRSVQDNSPAALAGMHAGDVVVRANSKPVASPGDWAKAIKNSHGHPLAVVVVRDKREQTLTLTPDSKKRSSLEIPLQTAPHKTTAPSPWLV